MIRLLSLLVTLFAFSSFLQPPSGDEILKKVDENMFSENKIVVSRMIIHGRRDIRTVESKSWQRGTSESYTEFLAPAREKGTKMLKLKDMLWDYSPSTDRTIMISGSLLRQSVMGSDLSYEDMMEDPHLPNIYSAKVVSEDTLVGRDCWILDLTAKKEDIAYHHRRVWVDKDRYVTAARKPLRGEREAIENDGCARSDEGSEPVAGKVGALQRCDEGRGGNRIQR